MISFSCFSPNPRDCDENVDEPNRVNKNNAKDKLKNLIEKFNQLSLKLSEKTPSNLPIKIFYYVFGTTIQDWHPKEINGTAQQQAQQQAHQQAQQPPPKQKHVVEDDIEFNKLNEKYLQSHIVSPLGLYKLQNKVMIVMKVILISHVTMMPFSRGSMGIKDKKDAF